MVGASNEASGGRAGSDGWSTPTAYSMDLLSLIAAWPFGLVMYAKNF